MEYSPFALDIEKPENDILHVCRELGVAVIAYSPIGRGLLSGNIRKFEDIPESDFRRMLPKYQPEHFPRILELVQGLENLAQTHDCTTAQVAIAWLLAQGSDIIPIPGTRSTKRADENAASALIHLTGKEIQNIRDLIERTEVPGARYHAA